MPTGVEEAAAFAGLVGLAFQCLSGCITGYQLLNTALHLGKHAAYLHCALLMEESRLLLWARRSGLSEENLDKRLNVRLVLEILGNLENLLCDVEKLRIRYKFGVEFKDPPSEKLMNAQYDPMSEADFSFMAQDDVLKERNRIVARSKAIQKKTPAYKKFWFAAVDKTKFGELISEINYLNLGLQGFLDDAKQAALETDVHLQRLQGVNLANKLNDIQALLEGLTFEDAKEAPLAQLKTIRMNEGTSPNETEEGKRWSSDLKNLLQQQPTTIHTSLIPMVGEFSPEEPVGSTGLHAVRTYDGQQVYIEWKKYGWAARDPERKRKALNSIASLALLLNAPKTTKFGTLHCMGLVDDLNAQSYQFVYNWPPNCDPQAKPSSLKDYLNSRFMPSLTDRIQLARDLANSIFLFHSPDWLHKNFCSDNILFFPQHKALPRSLKSPYIVGFEYSRPDTMNQPSERAEKDPELDIYRHPEYLGIPPPRFRRAFDIYSFGLVLVEIATWRPLKRVYTRIAWEKYLRDQSVKKQYGKDEAQKIQNSLFAECNEDALKYMRSQLLAPGSDVVEGGATDVVFRAGSIFGDVVLFCLGHELDKITDPKAIQEAYFVNVIKQLEACKV